MVLLPLAPNSHGHTLAGELGYEAAGSAPCTTAWPARVRGL